MANFPDNSDLQDLLTELDKPSSAAPPTTKPEPEEEKPYKFETLNARGSARPAGKPHYNPARVQLVLDSVRKGSTAEVAARAAGISRQSFYNWRSSYPEFAEALEQAVAESEQRLVNVVYDAAEGGDWKAAMAILERRFGARWSQTTRLQVELNQTINVLAAQFGLAPEDLLKEAQNLALNAGPVIDVEAEDTQTVISPPDDSE